MEILLKSWKEAEVDAFLVRQEVFILEQRVPAELELDEFDLSAAHVLAYQDAHCIGTGRLVNLSAKQAQIGRMAVLAKFRGKGIGKQILQKLVDLAASQGVLEIILHSQVSAIPFYGKLGFQAQGDVYEEAGIPHRNMMLTLANSD
ncbi:GNAT family N-acetyltransferase [Polynucleobacter yangtzensis]|uniref:GNAT family N-acetyltransferase n=1 Tax=Polynucleobacter yangtzensis TaxID=1743159 RepID=UPI000A4F1B06|nr:GNAT family N-acetyltransferase [Polynucleobacter yangtzensis]